jgi:hypothetical protein
MAKTKSLEKKMKPNAEFDKKNPESRKKSLNEIKKKQKVKASNDDGEQKVDNKKKRAKSKKVTKELILKEIIGSVKTDDAEHSNELPDKIVKRDIVKKALITLKAGVEKELEEKSAKNIFADELRLGLQIVPVKIPKCPTHTQRM